MLAETKLARALGPWLWLNLLTTASCGGTASPEPLVVAIPRVSPEADARTPPSEVAPGMAAPARDSSAERHEQERTARSSEIISQLRPRLEHCFLSRVPVLQKRRLTVQFVLRRDGSVHEVTLEPNPGGSSLQQCVARVLEQAGFERPAIEARVRIPLQVGVP